MPQVTCETCGAVFHRKPCEIYARVFCNVTCKQAAYKSDKLELQCAVCDKTFYRYACQLTKSKEVFCSKKCFHLRTGGDKIVHCVICGKELRRKPSFANRVDAPCCSMACAGTWRSQTFRGEKGTAWNGGKIEVQCATCSKPMLRFPSHTQYGHVFCGKQCYAAWMSIHVTGENHPTWKGGHIDYYGPNWEAQRRHARERDNHRCCLCGISEKKLRRNLDVHHIIPFRTFGYITGENENYREANELSNLVSLCTSCHKRAEWGYLSVQMMLC